MLSRRDRGGFARTSLGRGELRASLIARCYSMTRAGISDQRYYACLSRRADDRPIKGTAGMDKLAPKGFQPETQIPLGRMGDGSDIAHAAMFLFSPAAAWITGTVFPVDGGELHMRSMVLPYPGSLIDPESVRGLIKPRL